jgi:hypothetical protein
MTLVFILLSIYLTIVLIREVAELIEEFKR